MIIPYPALLAAAAEMSPPPPHRSIWLLGTVAALHIGLGIGLKLYFFNY